MNRLRRTLALGAAAGAAATLAGCATPSPPTQWYELRLDTPAAPAPAPASPAAAGVWELAPQVRLPGALDRDTLVVARADAGLEPLVGHRWAEPLREAVPRVLLHDLQRLHGADRVWAAPAPAGVAVTRRLRVEILALQADAGRSRVRVAARWWWLDAERPQAAPVLGSADLRVAVADPASIDAVAAALLVALARLAERIAASA